MSQPFQTPFGRTSTASEVVDGVGLSGQRAIVTGAGSGIGTETARALASAGAEVVLAVRRPQAAGQIAAGIAASTGNTKDCNEAPVVTRRPADYAGVAWYAIDPANAERLWDSALGLLPA
jgi:NAD(P)-dependent dehydrogenase (short-subunit alcohol dehydrogenase family)